MKYQNGAYNYHAIAELKQGDSPADSFIMDSCLAISDNISRASADEIAKVWARRVQAKVAEENVIDSVAITVSYFRDVKGETHMERIITIG